MEGRVRREGLGGKDGVEKKEFTWKRGVKEFKWKGESEKGGLSGREG